MKIQQNPNQLTILIVLFSLLITAGPVTAEPPMLSGLVIEPGALEVGLGDRTVNISVRVDDPDDDIKNVKVKKVIEGQKNPTLAILVDDGSNGDAAAGDGRFTANVTFSVAMAEQIRLLIRAKDDAKEKAKLKVTLPVVESVNMWRSIGPEVGDIQALAIDPKTPTTVYAGTGTDRAGVFKSTDGGTTWTAMNTGLPDIPTVTPLAIDPVTPTTVYAGTDDAGVFKSTDGGATWEVMNTGLTSLFVTSLAINPETPTRVYAGTKGGGLFRIDFVP